MSSADHHKMADNCENGARRLAASEHPPDQRDAKTLAAAAAIHRASATALERAEEATRSPRYWWHDTER